MIRIPDAVTRRDFLKGAALATLAATMGFPSDVFGEEESSAKTKVILIRNKDVITKEGSFDQALIDSMFDEAMKELFGTESSTEAWKLLFNSKDIIGIKSNEWGPLPTPPEVEKSIRNGLLSVGIGEENISINDRGILKDDIFSKATGYINVRPLRTHHWSGIGGCLKNPIMFSSKPWEYHGNSCADLGRVWELPQVKDKVRLNILVVFTPLFYGVGAHHFDNTYLWNYNGLIISTDPVAVDTVGIALFDAKRRDYFGERRPIKPPPHHVIFADTRYKLGTSDPGKIDLVKLGWKEDILI